MVVLRANSEIWKALLVEIHLKSQIYGSIQNTV